MRFNDGIQEKSKLFNAHKKALHYLDSIRFTARNNNVHHKVTGMHLFHFCKMGVSYHASEDQLRALEVFDDEYANGFENGTLRYFVSADLLKEEDPTRKLYSRFTQYILLPSMDQLRKCTREHFVNKVVRATHYTGQQTRKDLLRL